jgi:hypothetical protein
MSTELKETPASIIEKLCKRKEANPATFFSTESEWRTCGDSGEVRQPVLACPTCGYYCTHALGAYTLRGEDESARGEGVSEGYRSGAIVIRFSCEGCGHLFEVIFQQHKGETFVQTRIVLREDPRDNLPPKQP